MLSHLHIAIDVNLCPKNKYYKNATNHMLKSISWPSYPVLKMYFYTFTDNIKNQIQESHEQNVT
jgi:hypothetical protein